MCVLSHAQTINRCKQRFDQYLNFHGSLNELVRFSDNSVSIYNSKGEKEFTVYSSELDMLSEFFEHTSFAQQEELLKLKGNKKYSKRQRDSVWIYVDDRKKLPKRRKGLPLQGYRVAIDPGHFGANLRDADVEQKFLYFPLDSTGKDSVKIFESELTFNTGLIVKKMLEEQGVSVLLTRDREDHTSYDCSYDDWLKKHKRRVLDSLRLRKELTDEKFQRLITLENGKFFREFFKEFDLLHRAERINNFNPHATLIIHYNVDEKNIGWKKTTEKNFTMAFVPGAFTRDNFEKASTRIHFLRLLLTKEVEQSERISARAVEGFAKHLGIPAASQTDASYLKENCMLTNSKGVYARNLVMCRLVNSPLVYGEALYQDNEKECRELMKRDLDKFGVRTNIRLYKSALCYYLSLQAFLKASD